MDRPDDLAQLAARLKSLPLIESADLDQPFAAYDAFGVVMSAILCAALIQVPEDERERKNGKLFKRFVVERFPIKRGRGDGKYAADLWSFRSQAVKESRTGPFSLVHRLPWKPGSGLALQQSGGEASCGGRATHRSTGRGVVTQDLTPFPGQIHLLVAGGQPPAPHAIIGLVESPRSQVVSPTMT
jgi:hypothetical protein